MGKCIWQEQLSQRTPNRKCGKNRKTHNSNKEFLRNVGKETNKMK
jgi:hypothetical protein